MDNDALCGRAAYHEALVDQVSEGVSVDLRAVHQLQQAQPCVHVGQGGFRVS